MFATWFLTGYHPAVTSLHAPERLHFTGDDESDRLLARDPLALLIGFALDQQVTVQKAFGGPLELERRMRAPLHAATIAAMSPEELARLFQDRPALHRFPAAMAGRVQALCTVIAERYGSDAGLVWTGATDGRDLEARLRQLPGIGEMKAGSIIAVLVKRYGLRLPGIDAVLPGHPTLGDVDSPEALADYQAGKRAHKAALRAARG